MQARVEIYDKYFPQEDFPNYTPNFEDDELQLTAQELYEGSATVAESSPTTNTTEAHN